MTSPQAAPNDATPLSTGGAPGLALVLGTGGIGTALVSALQASGQFAEVLALGRATTPGFNVTEEDSIAQAAAWVAARPQPLALLVLATGFLHGESGQPERSWAHLTPAYLQEVLAVNTIGPALVMKHFLPLLPRQGRCVAAFLSARVGSIGDNALGGWYGYRASKAALNQLVKTASVELARRNKQAVCVALHPGTVDTGLSQPFAKTGLNVRPPAEAARALWSVLSQLDAQHTGGFFDHLGQPVPW